MLDDEALKSFATRPWGEIAEAKRRHWQEADLDPANALRLAEALRRHARTVRPGWPSEEDRRNDLDTHTRVARLLLKANHERRNGGSR